MLEETSDDSQEQPTQTEVDALKDELETLHGGDIKVAAQTLLEEKALQSIINIAKLASKASHERVRFDASKYIVERVLGPLNKIEPDPDRNTRKVVSVAIRHPMVRSVPLSCLYQTRLSRFLASLYISVTHIDHEECHVLEA